MDRSLFPGLLAFCLPRSPARPHNPPSIFCASAPPPPPLQRPIPSRLAQLILTSSASITLIRPSLPPFYSALTQSPLAGGWLAAKPGHNPLIFLHVVTASEAILLFFPLHLPCCAGWKPGLRSQAPRHMLQLYFLTCSRATLAKLPLQGSGVYSINTLNRARNRGDYGKLGERGTPSASTLAGLVSGQITLGRTEERL